MDQRIFTAYRQKINLKLIALVVLSSVTCGCAQFVSSKDPLLESLSGKGPVQITPENPFVAPVQYLTREMQKSKDLSGFIELKGYPKFIEISSSTFGAVSMKFLYGSGERYELELSSASESSASWIINGPFQGFPSPIITTVQEKFSAKPLTEPIKEKIPVLKTTATATRAPTTNPTIAPTSTPTPAMPVVTFTPAVEPALSPSNEFTSPSKISTPSEEAEITPRGDLVHYVTMQGETLSILARWYTKDRENAGKLSRLNRLKNPNVLTIGDTIVIPSYMVKNKQRLSEQSLQELVAATAEIVKKK